MEALTAASVAALTVYDMVKEIEREVEMEQVRLLEKSGGRHDWRRGAVSTRAAVVAVELAREGEGEDVSGPALVRLFRSPRPWRSQHEVVSDDRESILAGAEAAGRSRRRALHLHHGRDGASPRSMT